MEDYIYEEAKQIVAKKKKFIGNFTSWLIMSIFFLCINMLTSPGFHWWIFPTLGWGIGVAFHFFDAFGILKSKEWENREIKKEMKKMYANGRYANEDDDLVLDKIPNKEKLDLPDYEELKKEWDDQDFV
mgnify:CR=1 FL=1